MLLIDTLTADPIQQFVLTGIPGISVQCQLRFLPRIEAWILDVTYGNFTAEGILVVDSPNLLRQWSNIIPFGLACTRQDKLDPYLIDDFQNSTASLYLLDASDVLAVEAALFE